MTIAMVKQKKGGDGLMQMAAKVIDLSALATVKDFYHYGLLTRHQFKTLKGQVLAGNGDAAMRGLRKIANREGLPDGRN